MGAHETKLEYDIRCMMSKAEELVELLTSEEPATKQELRDCAKQLIYSINVLIPV